MIPIIDKKNTGIHLRRIHDNLDNSVFDCSDSQYEKQEVAVLSPGKV